ncbi:MAG: hypothetical protein EAZ55_08160 [Cytophagales bacterium]|nr:MAG: hypothetical protein EAZ55_08160 [Cytophagales bacterium]
MISCSKDVAVENPVKDLELYQTTKLDFNNDGNPDLKLEILNFGTADIPQSAGSNSFYVSSVDSNLTFLSKTVHLDEYWFEENKVLKIDTFNTFSSKYFYAKLYSRNIRDGNYNTDWKIDSEFSNSKIIVFRNKNTTNTKYGWIKLDFNISTKTLNIVDYYETTLTTITTGKK